MSSSLRKKYLSLSLSVHLPRSTSSFRLTDIRSISASVQKFGLASPTFTLIISSYLLSVVRLEYYQSKKLMSLDKLDECFTGYKFK